MRGPVVHAAVIGTAVLLAGCDTCQTKADATGTVAFVGIRGEIRHGGSRCRAWCDVDAPAWLRVIPTGTTMPVVSRRVVGDFELPLEAGTYDLEIAKDGAAVDRSLVAVAIAKATTVGPATGLSLTRTYRSEFSASTLTLTFADGVDLTRARAIVGELGMTWRAKTAPPAVFPRVHVSLAYHAHPQLEGERARAMFPTEIVAADVNRNLCGDGGWVIDEPSSSGNGGGGDWD